MSLLFSPLRIKNIDLKNRIVVSPMCQYSADEGYANDWHLVHLGSRAVGGAGLILLEATAVSPEGRISAEDLGIWSDDHIPVLKRITAFLHANGSVAGIQLGHAGRKGSSGSPWKGGKKVSEANGGWKTVAPSAVPFQESDEAPAALTAEGIEKVRTDFKAAARRALDAGFKVIEIHAAHGYLLHQFLSPLSNQRSDAYGGSFENRIRLVLEVVDDIKEVWPEENPLFVRISASDWADGGWTADESIALSSILKDKGVDLIDCSSGGLAAHQQIPIFPGYQVQFSEDIKKQAGILTGAVGLITDAEQAESILTEGKADLIFLARELLRDPYFPLHAAQILNEDIKWPDQYDRAKPRKSK
ncbi:NADPH dehydrogenase NamA [Pedobacter metabolipauper]|uniref:2,4-dienoyl-CoA reductase-like NADH-dependent reductase (Old Yellow Enzyme family) n=1 Tax=Pedobacter metabolipauper TaxID=425513 RepID=A0A4V3D183_9SPHI|nr:NADPH dehydrogenase NamA [Pedobacter metabolipauper]TDQ09667.1 2,4-dienoyl-CoA reductase-like NADH-dependent reductase (Old Yellow Enzyme family) [Pedobacter metabolipauper]